MRLSAKIVLGERKGRPRFRGVVPEHWNGMWFVVTLYVPEAIPGRPPFQSGLGHTLQPPPATAWGKNHKVWLQNTIYMKVSERVSAGMVSMN